MRDTEFSMSKSTGDALVDYGIAERPICRTDVKLGRPRNRLRALS